MVGDVPVDLDGRSLQAWGIDLAGNVLLIGGYGLTPPLYAAHSRWLDPLGAPLTAWFSVGAVGIRSPVLLVTHEGLALNDNGYFSRIFRSARPNAEAAPQWLKDRRGRQRPLTLVRRGNAYASFGTDDEHSLYGPCWQGIEVLTDDGPSCGCVAIPNVLLGGWIQGVGRDGSLITQRWAPGSTRGGFDVYPGLFR